MNNPFLEEIERLARISPATCAREGSPANNENVMRSMQAMIETLCRRLADAMDDVEAGNLHPDMRAHLRTYLATWQAAQAKQAATRARIEKAAEEATNAR